MRVHAVEQTIPLPATLNGQAVGDLNANVEDDQLRGLDLSPIRGQLQNLLSPDRYQMLPTNSSGLVPIATIQSVGIQTRFNFQSLTVDLAVPPELKRPQAVDLVGTPSVTGGKLVLPSTFAAYLNIRGGVDYVETSGINRTGFSDPQFLLENAFNFRGLVLENEVAINPAPDKVWEKRDTRLVFDDPEHRIRYTAGDLNYPIASLQGFLPMIGFSIARENSLQRYRITSPLGQSSFFLKQDSKVEVIINGHTVQTLQLSAGPQQIRNFPLTGGANDVVLRITDSVGRVEYINATFLYDPGLLKGGESEFNYAAGLPGTTDPKSPFYHYDLHPAISAYHRWGINDRLTVGLNVQATEDTQQGGAETVFSMFAGTVGLDAAFSHDRSLGAGSAQQLQYRYYAPMEGAFANGVFSLSAQHQDPHYTTPNPFSAQLAHSDLWNFSARYSQTLTDHISAGLGYSHQLSDHKTQRATYNFIAGYHLPRFTVDLSVDHNAAGTGSRDEWAAFLTLRINLDSHQAIFSSYDTSAHSSRTEWQYTPPNNFESVGATLGVQTTPNQEDIYGNFAYSGRRMELTLNQNTLTSGENDTSLRWGTALVYADGQFAVSRPVIDSFAIISSANSLHEDGGVGVERQGTMFQAQEDIFGHAVLPQVSSYYPLHVAVDPRQASADFDPEEAHFTLQPTYRSGTVIRVGGSPTLDATVTLKWPDGQPAALQVWTVTGPDGATCEIVSDRNGVAYLSRIVPGRYQAMISDYPETQFAFTIPASKQRQVNLGEIKLPAKP